MAAAAVQNPLASNGDSKSSRKKKAKAPATAPDRVDSPAPASEGLEKSVDDLSEHAYVRELQKSIRNINKKLTNTAKTETIIGSHPNKSLDELLAAKLINGDQKAQIEKKPGLVAQVNQLEEHLAQMKKMDDELRTKYQAEKAQMEKDHAEQLDKIKSDTTQGLQESLGSEHTKTLRDSLLVVSQFLRIAAARRAEDVDPNLDENRAIEGVLLGVYGGHNDAVDCMLNLVRGSEDVTTSVNGEMLPTTFADVKSLAQEFSKPLEAETAELNESDIPATDPTVANATLTEIRAGEDTSLVNGHNDHTEEQNASGLANADISDNANAAGHKWDQGEGSLATSTDSQDWVQVPRDPATTETEASATPVPATQVQSWAEDQPEQPAEPVVKADPNEGFHQVQRNRGRNDRGGNNNGGSSQGRGRGRGNYHRGEGRGRGRGGRGGNNQRGPRRTEES